MNKIFVAFSFRDRNEQLVSHVDRLIRSHGLVPVSGEILGGQDLTPEVQTRIQECDALIALMTRELQVQVAPPGESYWMPTQWVAGEYVAARTRNQLGIAIIEDGVRLNGPYAQNEHIKLDRAAPAEALVRLSETIGYWRAQAGRALEIRLVPKEAALFAASGNAKCQYRLVRPNAVAPSPWMDGRAARKPGGVFLVVPGVKSDDSIEVQLLEGALPRWNSVESPQWVHIELASV